MGPEAQRPIATTRHLTARQVGVEAGVELFGVSSSNKVSEEVGGALLVSFSLKPQTGSTSPPLGLILAGQAFPMRSTTGSTSMGSGPGRVQGPEGFPGSPGLTPLGVA